MTNKSQQPVDFTYKHLPAKYFFNAIELDSLYLLANSEKTDAYDLTNSLPNGYVTDNSVDYTADLQQGINAHKKVILPNFPVLINTDGLALKSNSTVFFQKNSALIVKPNDKANYQALKIFNIQNVTVYFPVIVGERDKHTGVSGEWGHGINIRGAQHIQIINPKVYNCWGDGIYIGKLNSQGSKSIKICYAVLDNERRNGISVTNADSLQILHAIISNIHGTNPMSAIDIEPSTINDTVNNIYVDDPITFNSQFGIIIALNALPSAVKKNINITINNHIDDSSNYAFSLGKINNNNLNGDALTGNIKILNPIWKHNKISFMHGDFYKYQFKVDLQNISIINNKSGADIKDIDSKKRLKNELININQINVN